MFFLALLIAGYAYFIFFLGQACLKQPVIKGMTGCFLSLLFFFLWQKRKKLKTGLKKFSSFLLTNKLALISFVFLFFQAVVNLIGALGPELSFDALWYHLTLPKIYLSQGRISSFPGGLLYYSHLPQLTEMLYLGALVWQGEILAKIIHFLFGLGCLFCLYRLLKRFKPQLALIGCLIFYSQLVVGWLSTTAYVDLSRTFFEILALDYFLSWLEKKDSCLLIKAGFLVGLAMAVKIAALFSLASFLLLIFITDNFSKVKNLFIFLFFAFLPSLPWLIINFFKHKNPFYPIFTSWFFQTQANGLSLEIWLKSRNLTSFLKVVLKTVFSKGDILTPLILITLPLIIVNLPKNRKTRIVGCYFFLNFIFFFLTPLNYNRFLLPYTPAFIFLLIASLKKPINKKQTVRKIVYWTVFLVAGLNLISRLIVNKKFLPVIFNQQSRKDFLAKNLNFKVNNFYDLDGWLGKNIKRTDRVLVIGSHNLFYLDHSFDHLSWAEKGNFYSHILVQNCSLPAGFGKLPVVYSNQKTGIKVFKFEKELE